MPLVQVVVGNKVAAPDLNQVIQALTGAAAHPFLLSGSYDTSSYPLNIWNTGAGGKMLFCRLNSGTFLDVTDIGIRLSPDGTLFNRIPVVTTGAQTISDKSIDGVTNTFSNIQQSSLTAAEGAIARRSSNLAITDNNDSLISWNSEYYDSGGFFTSGDTAIVCQRSGLYDCYIGIFFDDNGDAIDDLKIMLKVNAAGTQPVFVSGNLDHTTLGNIGGCWCIPIKLANGDSVQISVQQKSEATKNLTSESYFGIIRKGP